MKPVIEFTPNLVEDLRKAYVQAAKAGLKQFKCFGLDFHTPYAYYLLQYLDLKFESGEKTSNTEVETHEPAKI